MKMKTVVWIGPGDMIPGYGVGEAGKDKVLPEDMAESFVEQGKAKWPSNKKVEKTEEKD